jgi:hypothetical protein
MKRSRQRHARVDLPPMNGEQAYLLAAILEQTATAIWRAHGEAMADFQGRVFPDAPQPPDSVTVIDSDLGPDDDFF